MTKAPAVRFHQLLVPEHAAPSQHPPPLLNFYSVGSGPLHIICQSASLLILSPNNFSIIGNSPWLTSPLIFSYKGRKKSTTFNKPPTTSFQHLHHVANPLQFDLPLHQSGFFPPFLSCPNPQNSKLLLSCFL